jgi:hypothetical protein
MSERVRQTDIYWKRDMESPRKTIDTPHGSSGHTKDAEWCVARDALGTSCLMTLI